jgi:hypothetical protein
MPTATWNLAAGNHMDVQWSVTSPVAVTGFAVDLASATGDTSYALADHLPSVSTVYVAHHAWGHGTSGLSRASLGIRGWFRTASLLWRQHVRDCWEVTTSMVPKPVFSCSRACSALAPRGRDGRYAPGSSKFPATLGWNADVDFAAELVYIAEQTGVPEESHTRLITFVPDRLGHDRRYALDSRAVSRAFGWQPSQTMADGIRRTLRATVSDGVARHV